MNLGRLPLPRLAVPVTMSPLSIKLLKIGTIDLAYISATIGSKIVFTLPTFLLVDLLFLGDLARDRSLDVARFFLSLRVLLLLLRRRFFLAATILRAPGGGAMLGETDRDEATVEALRARRFCFVVRRRFAAFAGAGAAFLARFGAFFLREGGAIALSN